jgi:hypothetical protein
MGGLPWSAISGDNKIQEAKMNIPLSVLCQDLPDEFIQFIETVRELKFDEHINYTMLRRLFVKVMMEENFAFDFRYDWVIAREQRLSAALTETYDPMQVRVQIHESDIAARISANSKAVQCLPPMPFFTTVQLAATFMGRSRRHITDTKPTKPPKWVSPVPDAFLLTPDHVKLPVPGENIEFEFDRHS